MNGNLQLNGRRLPPPTPTVMKHTKLIAMVTVLLTLPWAVAQPKFTIQPTNTSVSLGATAQFRGVATSTNTPVTYQWWFKETALDTNANPSAAKSTLSLTNVTLADGGPYFVVASDTSGLSTNSQVATLTVDPTFTKITTGLVVTDLGGWEGSNWWDFDKDGFLDLYVANTTGSGTVTDALYRNNGDGTFTKVTNTISTTRGRSGGSAVGDYNNDGYDDLLVTHPFDGADDLYRNKGAGVCTRMKKAQVGPVVSDADYSTDAAWGDFDADGFIDLFTVNGQYSAANDCLYWNNGDGSFTKMTTNQVGMLGAMEL